MECSDYIINLKLFHIELNKAMASIPNEQEIQEFIIAIRSGSFECMKEILDKFKNNISNKLESQYRQPPLYFAAVYSDEELSLQMVKALVQVGANVYFRDSNEQTILFYACKDGKRSLVQYLQTLGCKLEDEDLYGQSPIFYVASENQLDMLDLFTSEMVNHVDQLAKQTPLFYAVRKGHLEMCKALVEKGCDITHQDINKKTVADYARKSKYLDVSEYLNGEMKKIKEINKAQSQLIESSLAQEQIPKKKKKEVFNTTTAQKATYKLSIMKDNGEFQDLTEDELKELYESNPRIAAMLANPDSISVEAMEEYLQSRWEKDAVRIFNQVWKVKGAYHFHDPVDPVKYGVLDYFNVIEKPMDLNTIKKKVNFNCYKRPEQFIHDMNLIWSNCYEYNGQDHEISRCAKELEMKFDEAMKECDFEAKFLQSE